MKKILVVLLSVSAMSFAGAAEGKAVYTSKCQMCHGPDGVPKESMAKSMGLKPLAQSSADVKEVVTKGKGKMKPIAGLSEKQVDDVAAYVESLRK